jgi:hypothetical protein
MGHVEHTQEMRNSVRNQKGIHHFGDMDADGKIILKLILDKYNVNLWTGLNWLRIWCNMVMNLRIP